ncbi:MAG: thioredoxin domain-containing protein [Asticcacaulis sp.]|uniref:thioredoxin domain-containing protein n=1 Tax=Asticcacaulis sp. TaxID=1872648 RepID=UPI0039E221CC
MIRRIAAVVLTSFLIAAPLAQAADLSPALTKIAPTDHVLGSASAPVTIIEYGSVACPACASFNESVFPQLKAKYIDTGQVRYVFRPMLTGVPVIAVAGTRMAECAGNDKYFAVVDAVMRGQKEYYAWGESNIIAQPILVKIAASFGLSEAAYNTCASDAAGLSRLQAAHKAALDAGVRATPTLYVNGKAVEQHDLDSVEAAIKAAK